MAKTKEKHTHKYLKVDIGVNKPYLVYRCVLAGCSHYIPATYGMFRGRAALCWRCDEPFQIGRYQLKGMLTKPHCDKCIERETVLPDALIEDLVSDSLDDVMSPDISELMSRLK